MNQAQRDTAAVLGYVESLPDPDRLDVQRCLNDLKLVLYRYPDDCRLLAVALLGIEAAVLIDQIGALNDMVGNPGQAESPA